MLWDMVKEKFASAPNDICVSMVYEPTYSELAEAVSCAEKKCENTYVYDGITMKVLDGIVKFTRDSVVLATADKVIDYIKAAVRCDKDLELQMFVNSTDFLELLVMLSDFCYDVSTSKKKRLVIIDVDVVKVITTDRVRLTYNIDSALMRIRRCGYDED